jgi:RNA polymerase sigma-70 factor (ECF subfamily)
MLGTLVHELHRTEEGRLRSFFLRRLRNAADAADATQETFLRLLTAAPAGVEKPTGYLYRTAHSVAVDKARRNANRAKVECPITDERAILNVASDVPSPESEVIDRDRLAHFEAALLALPERSRTVLLLNRKEGWSFAAIAQHLGVSQTTVYNDLRLAMAHCMDAMARLERG